MGSPEASCSVMEDKQILELCRQGEASKLYPYIWLRDNCQCEKCFHSGTESRKRSLQDLPMDPKVQQASIQKSECGDNHLHISWTDGHMSVYPVSWLAERAFPPRGHSVERGIRYRTKPKLWGTEMQGKLPMVDFQQLLSDDAVLYDWIVNLDRDGVCIISGAPTEKGQIVRLGERVAWLTETFYGKTFEVKTKLSPSNPAYTSGALPLHTDLACLHSKLGTQLLHCIRQSGEGGESTISDGFLAAKQLQQQHPDYYRLLCDNKMDYFDRGSDALASFHYVYHGPFILLDCYGELDMVNYSLHSRDSFMGDVPLEDVAACYKAMRKYDDLLYENKVTFKMRPGNILMVDNRRVLHGREAITMVPGEDRFLEGGYIEWDHLYSRMRVLARKLGKEKST